MIAPVLTARRPPSRAGAARAEEAAVGVDLSRACVPRAVEAGGLPDLEFLAQADKSDFGADAGVGAKRLRQHDAAVAVEIENLDVAVERDRELVPLVRIVRQAPEKPVDFVRKSLAAGIECRSIERGVAVDAGAAPPP